jgi:hypothetical protein
MSLLSKTESVSPGSRARRSGAAPSAYDAPRLCSVSAATRLTIT